MPVCYNEWYAWGYLYFQECDEFQADYDCYYNYECDDEDWDDEECDPWFEDCEDDHHECDPDFEDCDEDEDEDEEECDYQCTEVDTCYDEFSFLETCIIYDCYDSCTYEEECIVEAQLPYMDMEYYTCDEF